MLVFCDTSAFYAVANSQDASHHQAASLWRSLVASDRYSLVTTNYVVVETLSLVQKRVGLSSVRRLNDAIGGVVDVAFVEASLHEAALRECIDARKRAISFVDYVTFAFMRRNSVKFAFAFDDDFRTHGFAMITENRV